MTENSYTTPTQIRIDKELRDWIIPLRPEEYSELEKSIISDGCRDPLVIWNGIIADGHHRFKICTEHNIPFNTVEKSFESKDDVKLWMVRNQIARRNLEPIQKIALTEKLRNILETKSKLNLKTKDPQYINVPKPLMNSSKAEQPINTRKELAKFAGVSEQTYARGSEILNKKPEVMKEIVDGNNSINNVFTEIKKEEKQSERRQELAQKTAAAKELPDTITLHHGDFLKEYTKLKPSSVDCIITDPPYVKEWIDNYEAFAKAAEYVLKPGGFLITYIGHIHMDKILAQMTPHLDYFWVMMIKHSGMLAAVHSRSVQCRMKPILIFNKSPRTHPKRYFNDVIMGSGREKDSHEWQQGEEELRQIFEPFTDPGDTILDPFMGSGTTIAMAKKLNRIAIGFDINQENVDIVKGRLSEG